MHQDRAPIVYQAPGVPFAVSIRSQGSQIFAAVGNKVVMEFHYEDTRLTLVQDYSGAERERIHLHVFEFIFGHDRQLASIDCSQLQAPLSDQLSHRLVLQAEGRPCLDRQAFFQYAPLWHRRQGESFEPERWTETNGRAHPLRPRVAPGVLYRRYLPGFGRTLSFELFDSSRHLDIYHKWHNQYRVSKFWEMAFPKEQLAEYIGKMESDPHQRPIIALLDDEPVGYYELYWTPENRLGPYYEYDPFDRGYHFLVGEISVLGGTAASDFIQSMAHYIFLDDPRTRRVMGEPRHDNISLLRYLQKIPGWVKIKEFDFPHKRAALLQLRREDFFVGDCI